MKFRLFILLIMPFVVVRAQNIITPNFTIKSSSFEVESYANSSFNIYYKYSFVNNQKTGVRNEILGILQIGNNVSKFSDFNQLKMDSLREKYSHQPFIGAQEMSELMKVNVLWNTIVVKRQDSIVVQDRFKNTYQYTEAKPKFQWEISDEKKIILGHECRKASTRYKGRDYTAWYAVDIPLNEGPYKFYGLPGLIMEIEDSKKEFHFLAVGITKTVLPVYLRNGKNIFKVNRKTFRNIEMSYHENPGFFHGRAFNADGSQIIPITSGTSYNSIELE